MTGPRASDRIARQLRDWFATQLPGAGDVTIEGVDRVTFGHSAETFLLTLVWSTSSGHHRRDVVLRLRPPVPGLLEPYDLYRQFEILRALERTPVPAPRALWYEGTGDVLGREFYVMERLGGTVYEEDIPPELLGAPERLGRMSRRLVETIAAIHRVDLAAVGLQHLDGRDHLIRELDHWTAEMQRVRRDRLPALDRLATELADRKPAPSKTVTLVHGDPKPGNFAFEQDEVSAVFDWELATVGDPLTDVGWAECNWTMPGSFTSLPGALTVDEFVAYYEELTGITVCHREWYRAFETFKMSVIMLVAAMLFDSGASDDLRFAGMGLAVHHFTTAALADLGIDEALESGPVTARRERVRAVRARGADH
jgi:aminoglycoside phosphotransferase (APT) family kinase protein